MFDTLQIAAYYSIVITCVVIFLAFIVSCERMRYYIKFCFFIFIAATVPTISIPFMLLRIRDWRNAIPTAWCLKLGMRLLGVQYHVRGKENLVQNSGSIVLINHQSSIDLTVLAELWLLKRKSIVISKKEVMYFGPFGIAIWLWGTIFINRQKSKEAYNVLNEAGDIVKDSKANLLIFPEGHRHSNSSLMPFKKGAFHTAITKQLPIQPIVVSKYYFLNAKQKIFNSGVSYITILPAISTENLTLDDLPMLMEKVYECMNTKFSETSEEVLNNHINTLKTKQ
ncbi:1-acyl-sn-glycerol-3-phosphate acyltransferase alpha isoform X1 [Megalopta genalis]|uniref:1-acyl-sn-glycerol-3-phosphate acyltransferase alpha isoform X1 n=2 Tax=Megalopta genalis TaxID=115081 RepID=UPI001443154F|nr:1-acyl-sn-glycerol-3-phosphate acyltransferase alpha-like isoform X1 [Megalopta genalis]